MALHYRLVPPFLHVPEENSFPDAWEAFSCKLLNLEHGTTEIVQRSPPEQGLDLFWPSEKIAYQCKSVESGKPGDFNVSHAIDSYKAALKIQSALGWLHYAVCTNVALTGTAVTSLKGAIPGVQILPASHWVQLCETKSAAVARNFRTIVDVQPGQISYGLNSLEVSAVLGEPDQTDSRAYTVLLYCNRHDRLYQLPVRSDLTIGQLVQALTDLFHLPKATRFSEEQLTLSLSHGIVVEGRKIPIKQTLADAGIGPDALVTYWTTIMVQDAATSRSFHSDVIHMATAHDFAPRRSLRERRAGAVKKYEAQIRDRFAEADRRLDRP